MDRIAAAEKAAVTEVRLAAAEVATRAAERVIGTGLEPELDAPLVDHAIAGLPRRCARPDAATRRAGKGLQGGPAPARSVLRVELDVGASGHDRKAPAASGAPPAQTARARVPWCCGVAHL